jgi:hypothetical protein
VIDVFDVCAVTAYLEYNVIIRLTQLEGEAMSVLSEVNPTRVGEFCQKWKIAQLALFGSALRPDFGPASDVDVLVTFSADSHASLFDLVQMEEELTGIFARKVDLISRRGPENSRNYIRRKAILDSAQVLYAT